MDGCTSKCSSCTGCRSCDLYSWTCRSTPFYPYLPTHLQFSWGQLPRPKPRYLNGADMGFVDKQLLVPLGLLVLYWAYDGTTRKSFCYLVSCQNPHSLHLITTQPPTSTGSDFWPTHEFLQACGRSRPALCVKSRSSQEIHLKP